MADTLGPDAEEALEAFRRISLTGLTTAGFAAPSEKARFYQKALNEQWPPGTQARTIPDRDPIAVWARVVWERDGELWVAGEAVKWDQRHVLVAIHDPRVQTRGFWLRPADVHRRRVLPPAD